MREERRIQWWRQAFFVITSSNIQGLGVEGETLNKAIEEASYDIVEWFEAKRKVEEVQDPSTW